MQTVRVRIITQVRGRKGERLCSTKLGSRSEACRYSPSHPLLGRKRGGFSICMLVCNSWHYITCRRQSNSCGIVKVLFHTGEQSVELHSWEGGGGGATWRQLVQDARRRDHLIKSPLNNTTSGPDIDGAPPKSSQNIPLRAQMTHLT